MRYFNESDVQNFKKSIILDSYNFSKRAAYQSFDVFLSHSSKDDDILSSVINFLSQYNVNVYIDKSDEDLPKKPSPETGEVLKNRIQEAKKFMVLVSPNSKDSKWIPWELGIADEKKKIRNVALLPQVQSVSNPDWPEQEYLGLYPRIVYGKLQGYQAPVWMVLDHHSNTGTELGKWLRQA
jgi:hypothetical protein